MMQVNYWRQKDIVSHCTHAMLDAEDTRALLLARRRWCGGDFSISALRRKCAAGKRSRRFDAVITMLALAIGERARG